jgi:probable HAF family extracellular repeat protein
VVRRTWCACVLLAIAPCTPAFGSCAAYVLTDLGVLGGLDGTSGASGINDYGQVVGVSQTSGGDHAYLWTPASRNGTIGAMIDLGELPGGVDYSTARDINSHGQVVGMSNSSAERAFLWTPTSANGTTGSMVDLGDLPGGFDASEGYGINACGQVVGLGYAALYGTAFLWTPDVPNGTSGTMVNIGDLPGGNEHSVAYAINDVGQISGEGDASRGLRGFLWTPAVPNGSTGSMANLGDPPRSHSVSYARDLNSRGEIVGYNFSVAGGRAFLWTPTSENGTTGSMTELGDLPGGIEQSFAYAIADTGCIAGGSSSAEGTYRAALWSADGQLFDLNDLLDASGAGWTLTAATDINNVGQIVAEGQYDPDGPGGASPVTHGILLTPIPEAAMSLFCASASAAGLLIRRRR